VTFMQHPVKKEKRASRKKRALRWILLLVALGLAVALVALLPRIRQMIPGKTAQQNQLPPPREQRLLKAEDPAQLATVRIAQRDSEPFTLGYRDGALFLMDHGEWLDINDVYSDDLISAATYIMVSDKVTDDPAEVEPYLADMGLLPPRAEVTVTFTDGREYTMQLGNQVHGTTYSYFRWSEMPGVYMCDTGVSDAFLMSPNRLRPVEQPQIAAGLVDNLRLETKDGVLAISLEADVAGNRSGRLTEPFVYPMNDDYLEAVVTALESFRLGTFEGEATEERLAQYGLNDPVAVLELHQNGGTRMSTDENGALSTIPMEETTLRFVFGRQEGEYFYTCLYEGNVYLVSRLLCQVLVEGTPEDWISLYPLRMSSLQLGAVDITTPSDEMHIHAQYTERVLPNNELEVDLEGNLIYDITVKVDEDKWSSDGLDNMAGRMYQLRGSGRVPEGFTIQGKTPRWTMDITTVYGESRLVEAYMLDPFADVLAVDGVAMHYVHSEAIQMLLGELAPELTF